MGACNLLISPPGGEVIVVVVCVCVSVTIVVRGLGTLLAKVRYRVSTGCAQHNEHCAVDHVSTICTHRTFENETDGSYM